MSSRRRKAGFLVLLATGGAAGLAGVVLRDGTTAPSVDPRLPGEPPALPLPELAPLSAETLPADPARGTEARPWGGLSPEWAEAARERCEIGFPLACADFAAVLEQQTDDVSRARAQELHRLVCRAMPASPSCVALGRAAASAGQLDDALAILDDACAAGAGEACEEARRLRGDVPRNPTIEELHALSVAHWNAAQAELRVSLETDCSQGGSDACRTAAVLQIQSSEPREFEAGVARLRAACDGGDGLACGELGRVYYTSDPALARELLHAACLAGDGGACVDRDVLDGTRVPEPTPDEILAGNQQRMLELGTAQLREARDACVLGDAASCLLEAQLLLTGQAGESDERRATERFAALCDGGLGVACYELGILRGLSSPGERAQHYRRACELGFTDACTAPELVQ